MSLHHAITALATLNNIKAQLEIAVVRYSEDDNRSGDRAVELAERHIPDLCHHMQSAKSFSDLIPVYKTKQVEAA